MKIVLMIILGTLVQAMNAQTARVSLFSEPPDAEVFLDTIFVGRTPVKQLEVPEGMHRIRFFTPSASDWNAIARSETADISRWPAPEIVLWSPPDGDPSDDLYCNGKSLYPGTQTMHLAFVTLYRRRADASAIRLASSLDSALWEWLPGEVLQCGPPESWDG